MKSNDSKKTDTKKRFMSYISRGLDIFNGNKFSNINVSLMINMDIDDVRKVLLDEIDEIETEESDYKVRYLQRIFDKIFSFQPSITDDMDRGFQKVRFLHQRLYADIIATPNFLNRDFIKDFLINNYEFSSTTKLKYHALIKIMTLYESLNSSSVEKFNYCFRNSSKFADMLLTDNRIFDRVLSDRHLSMFSKETFCQIFNFLDVTSIIESYFFNVSDKSLFLIAQMGEHVYRQTGAVYEFFDAVVKLNYDSSSFNKILDEFYDKYIGNDYYEDNFKSFIEDSFPIELNIIINNIFDYYYDFDFFNPFNSSKNISDFMFSSIKKDIVDYDFIFSKWKEFKGLRTDKIIISKSDLDKFKEIIFKNIYGISLMQAGKINQEYGYNLNLLNDSIITDDREIYELLKAIVNINSLDVDNIDGIMVTMESYLKFINKNGINCISKHNSFIVLECLLKRMYINTYNKFLFNDLSDHNTIEVVDGVRLIDAGTKFNMIVSSVNDVSKFFHSGSDDVNNLEGLFIDNGQCLCASFINNQNLGVISLSGQLLGFSKIPIYSLGAMGPTDILNLTKIMNMRFSSKLIAKIIVGDKMADETRYGYNEILINKFLNPDIDYEVEIKPDYLVFYKISENFKVSKRWSNTLKVAKCLNLPVVIIDFQKVLKYEKDCLKKMAKELFNSDSVNKDLLFKIVTRYMNNISGSRIIYGSSLDGGLELLEDFGFPRDSLGAFIEEFIEKCRVINGCEKLEWIDALDYVYKEEIRKHIVATSISSYNCSIGYDRDSFCLDSDYNLGDIIHDLRSTYDKKYKSDEENRSIVYVDRKISSEVDTIIKIANLLNFNVTYNVEKIVDDDSKVCYFVSRNSNGKGGISLEERLIISYFTDNYEDDLLFMLNDGLGKNIKFGKNKHFFPDKVMSSIMYANLDVSMGIDMNKINEFIEKIDNLNGYEFFSIFYSYIYQNNLTGVISMEALEKKIINKKKNLSREFKYLSKMINK